MSTEAASRPDGEALMREFVKHSPFAGELGLEVGEVAPGRAEIRLPFRPELATYGTVLHGGAIATAADVAAMVASFAGAELTDAPRGATVGLSLSYLRAVRERDVTAVARVVRRGRSLNFVALEVLADGEVAAHGHAVYKLD